MSAFKNFLLTTNLSTLSAYVTHTILLQFIAYLVSERKLAYNTVCLYINAVRDWTVSNGYRDPLDISKTKLSIFKKFLNGVRRHTISRRHYRLPFRKREMRLLLEATSRCAFTEHVQYMFKAAILCAYFGCLRVSEYTLTKFNTDTFLRRKDVKFIVDNQGKLSRIKLRLRRTKTTQFGSIIYVDIFSAADKRYCPVHALFRYNQYFNQTHDMDSPFFHTSSQPLTNRKFGSLLKTVVEYAGLDSKRYSSHSLRAGGATVAADSGAPSWVVQRLGRWKSDCYKIYIRNMKNSINRAQSSMAL